MNNKYIAHIDGDRVQPLEEHLNNTGLLAAQFAKPLGLSKEAEIIGKTHDIGKYKQAFQDYIRGIYKGRVDHSSIGGKFFLQNKSNLGVIGAFCIAGHHCGLQNMLDRDGNGLIKRLQKEYPGYEECVALANCSIPVLPDKIPAYADTKLVAHKKMDLMMLIRMMYSCLVDADFLDTERFMNPEGVKRGDFPAMDELHRRFWTQLKKMGFMEPKNELNKKRLEILETCHKKGESAPGLFTLTVPTGGGKTISSLAFALEQAIRHHKDRIIYVIPYTSIIDQTADVFKKILGENTVLENHCQVSYDYDEEKMPKDKAMTCQKMKLASENWDVPVIVTTNEQFFESLFSNRASKCRKLHNIVNSVVIMDECQMLPVDFLTPTLRAVEELITFYHCSAVLCSATQPRLEKYLSVKPKEIVPDINELYDFFQRTSYTLDGEMAYEDIARALMKKPQSLCVASTIQEANEIYKCLPSSAEGIYYLSTRLCPVHRKRVIREIKKRLASGLPCHVVSTSIISVGVDVDFPVVYLEYGGLDALIQGAGRCNREGRHGKEESLAHIFWTQTSKKSRFMSKEKEAADMVLNYFAVSDLSKPDAVNCYYRAWYKNNEGSMDKKDIAQKSIEMGFADVAKAYRLIEDESKSVLIPYDEKAKEILRKLQCGIRTRSLLRQASQYMVNIRSQGNKKQMSDFDILLSMGKIEMCKDDESLAYLVNDLDYNPVTGLQAASVTGNGFLF